MNGVSAATGVSPRGSNLLTLNGVPGWDEAAGQGGARVDEARDDELWRVREQGREAMVSFVRSRLGEQLMARGHSSSDVEWTNSVLDPKALTICFARRFATYKRATLLLERPERLDRKSTRLNSSH